VMAALGLATLAAWAGGAGFTAWGAQLAGRNAYRFVSSTPEHASDFGKSGLFALAAGLVMLVIAPFLARATTRLDLRAASALLGPSRSQELELRVETLSESRAGVVDAADAERRRIERDLHDGAQQRLVSLAMNLGIARENLTDLPDDARQVIIEAHEEAKAALAELRDLIRGLHPAVLEDRGLDAALSGVAARMPMPVRLTVDMQRRPAPVIEAVAYFVVSEGLANIAKHSEATEAAVFVQRAGNRLHVIVTDDGSDDSGVVDPGAVPCAVAVLVTDPASTFARVVEYVAVQVSLTPGASVPDGQLIADRPGRTASCTRTPDRVTFPALVTRKR